MTKWDKAEFDRQIDAIRKANAEIASTVKPRPTKKVPVTAESLHLLPYDNTSSPEEIEAANQAAKDFKEEWSC